MSGTNIKNYNILTVKYLCSIKKKKYRILRAENNERNTNFSRPGYYTFNIPWPDTSRFIMTV